MTRWAMATGILAASGLASVPTATAESRFGLRIVVAGHDHGRYGHDHGYGRGPDYGDYAYDASRLGYSRGFEDGYDHGRDDAEDRDGFNFWHHKEYRNADHGYRGHYGPRWGYQRGYRSGYEDGYRRAFAHFEHRHDHGRCERSGSRDWRDRERYDARRR